MKENTKVHELLILKAQQISAATELLISKTRDWQIIRQFLCNRLNDIVLSAEQQKKLERYQFIYNQLASGRFSKNDVINATKKMYGIGLTQVYDDINCTQEIFSSVININKLFELNLELESAKEMKRKCIEVNDIRTAAIVQKNIIALQAMIPDADLTPGEDFEGHNMTAVFDPRLLGAPDINMNEVLAAINAKRKVKIHTDMFEEINYTTEPLKENGEINPLQ